MGNNPDPKGQVLYDSTYMRYLEQVNSETESIREVTKDWGKKRMGSYCLISTKFLFEMIRKFQEYIVAMLTQHCEYK